MKKIITLIIILSMIPIVTAQNWADNLFNQAFQTGDFYGAIYNSYYNVLGASFYLILIGMALMMIYIKTQNFGVVATTGMLMSTAIALLVPSIFFYAISTVIALGIATVLYRVFR
jgi:hypothetical protein